LLVAARWAAARDNALRYNRQYYAVRYDCQGQYILFFYKAKTYRRIDQGSNEAERNS
jgi:hypothetical protein